MKVLFGKRLRGMGELTGEDSGETERGWRNRVVGKERGFEENV